ncbi:MAG: hypothetical protein Q9201_001499 [Fulgogasparrea decipioides]
MHPPFSSLVRSLRLPIASSTRNRLQIPLAAPLSARPCPSICRLPISIRLITASPHLPSPPPPSTPPFTTDRGPTSQEDTQTDFSTMNVLGSTPPPTTAIDACLDDGFHLDSGVKIGGGSGCLLVGGEAFGWRPWKALEGKGNDGGKMVNAMGQWQVGERAWGILEVVWPKPDLLILGLGPHTMPISPETRKFINNLGIRVDVQDTRNAAAQFNLLATERGMEAVAAALVPLGWKELTTTI